MCYTCTQAGKTFKHKKVNKYFVKILEVTAVTPYVSLTRKGGREVPCHPTKLHLGDIGLLSEGEKNSSMLIPVPIGKHSLHSGLNGRTLAWHAQDPSMKEKKKLTERRGGRRSY